MTATGAGEDTAATALAKAETLIEALPWLSRFHGQTVVIKYGGHAMTDDVLRAAFAQDVVFLRHAGIRPVVVHGGGPQISAHLDRLGVESTFQAGLRVTSPEAMDVVRMVLTGQVNRDLVGLINRNGPFAIGMSGEDANLFTASRRGAVVDGEPVDLGLVGEIDTVDPGAVLALLRDGRVQVISSVARGEHGEIYNVNADTAAAAVAVALDAAKLVVLTDVEGLYANWQGAGQHTADDVISLLGAAELEALLPGLSAGMIPKMEACLRAVRGGVPQAHVLDGRLPHSVLLEIFTDSGIGTMVIPDPASTDPASTDPASSDPASTGSGRHTRRAPMTATERLQERYEAALMPNYGIPPLALARGEGCRVWDADGREYTDMFAGIAVSSLGHAHPAITGAVSRQVATLAHTSNLFVHEGEVALAERLLSLLGAMGSPRQHRARPGVLRQLGNRGQRGRAQTGPPLPGPGPSGVRGRRERLPRPDHGRLALTGKSSIREPFGPFGITVRFVPYGDVAACRRRPGTTPRPCSWSRPWVRAAWSAAPRLPAGRPGRLRRVRRTAGGGRDPERHRPHRRVVRLPGRRGHAGRAHAGQGPGRRAAHRRLHRPGRRRHRVPPGRPRQHVRRQPGGLRRGPGRAGHHRGRRPAGARRHGRPPACGRPRPDQPPLQAGVRGRGLWLPRC